MKRTHDDDDTVIIELTSQTATKKRKFDKENDEPDCSSEIIEISSNESSILEEIRELSPADR